METNWPSYKCCPRCGCLMDISLIANHTCAARIEPMPCDAWDSRCSQYRSVLERIADRTAFDTIRELKDMARAALAKAGV